MNRDGVDPVPKRPACGSPASGTLACAVVAITVLMGAGTAWSQPVAPVGPGGILPQGSPLPRVVPQQPPQLAPTLPVPGPATPAAGLTGAVTIRSVGIDGATAYNQAQVAPMIAGLVGPAIPVEKIEQARVALLNQYRADGYALTSVTASVDARGNLRFAVIEGRIVDVKLDGDIGPAGTQVLRFLRHLTEVRPLDTATLERWLLLAQDVPGISVRAVLQPSADEPGALTLVAQVQHKIVSGVVSADNRAFRLTGTEEGVAVMEVDSLTQFGERTQATIYHTNGNTQNFGQGSVEVFLGGSGLKLKLYGGYGKANPSDFLRTIGYEGTTGVFGASLSYPVIRSRAQTLNVSAMFDAVNSTIRNKENGVGESIVTGQDYLRIFRLGADYALQDNVLGDDRPAINSVSARLSQGVPGLGATANGSPTASRKNEKVDFTKFMFDASRVQTLFQPWSTATVALKGRVLGQVSSDVLPPAEKFFLGGSEFNRGYYAGEVTGDSAVVLSAELQLNTSHEFTAFGRPIPISAQYYAFYDFGYAWQNQSLDPNASLNSTGIGVRASVTRFTEFGIEGVHRWTRYIYGHGAGNVSPLKADALYWRVTTRF